MPKILFAIGHRELEEYLASQLAEMGDFEVVGAVVYREGILTAIKQKNPDIVIIRETLDGTESIMKIIYDIRLQHPHTRIIFIAGNRKPGDAVLATLVSYGVFDILQGKTINASDILALIKKPNDHNDVKHLVPMVDYDENTNKMLFKAPPQEIVYIEKEIRIEEEKKEVAPEVTKETAETPKEPSAEKPKAPKTLPSLKFDGILRKPKWNLFKKASPALPTLQLPNYIRQQIIAFVGTTGGVGTTSISFNAACLLSEKGYKVMYLELNPLLSATAYWYELAQNFEQGIDAAILGIETNNFKLIETAFVTHADLLQKGGEMADNYKQFPKNLSMGFFSKKYIDELKQEEREEINASSLKDLLMYLLYQMGYDFVFLDMGATLPKGLAEYILLYSSQIYLVVTQDVNSIAETLRFFNDLKKNTMLTKEPQYIINKYDKHAMLTVEEIEQWVEAKKIITVPCLNREFINANFVGLPLVIQNKKLQIKELAEAFHQIITSIISQREKERDKK